MKKQHMRILSGCAALLLCMTAAPAAVSADYGVGGNGTATALTGSTAALPIWTACIRRRFTTADIIPA